MFITSVKNKIAILDITENFRGSPSSNTSEETSKFIIAANEILIKTAHHASGKLISSKQYIHPPTISVANDATNRFQDLLQLTIVLTFVFLASKQCPIPSLMFVFINCSWCEKTNIRDTFYFSYNTGCFKRNKCVHLVT